MDDPYIRMGSEEGLDIHSLRMTPEGLFDIHSLWMTPALGWEGGGEGLFDIIHSLCRNKAQSGSIYQQNF